MLALVGSSFRVEWVGTVAYVFGADSTPSRLLISFDTELGLGL